MGGDEITSYNISISPQLTSSPVDVPHNSSQANQSTTLSGLDPGTDYLIEVAAVNGGGIGGISNTRQCTSMYKMRNNCLWYLVGKLPAHLTVALVVVGVLVLKTVISS